MDDEFSYSDDTEFMNGSEHIETPQKILKVEDKPVLPQENLANVSKVESFLQIKVKRDDEDGEKILTAIATAPQEEGTVKIEPVVTQENVPSISEVRSFDRKQVESDDEGKRGQASTALAIAPQEESVKIEQYVDTEAATSQGEKKFTPVTHVIFDLDGTLLDTEKINNGSIAGIASEYDKEFTPEIQCRVMGRVSREASITAVRLMDIPITPEEFDARVEILNFQLMAEVALMPGAERLIRHLYRHEVPIAVATSASRPNYEIKSTKHKELFSRFHHVVSGGSDPEVLVGKPAPDIYLVCASRFPDKPKPDKCLAIEDSPNGVKAAVNAGMQVVMIPDPCTKPEFCTDATLVLKTMEDFRPELFGLPEFDSN